LRLVLAAALAVAALAAQGEERSIEVGGKTLRYTLVQSGDPVPSALSAAREILRLLAEGQIAQAASFSNAPGRRQEVLQDYRASVGEEGFKRIFARYARSPVRAEIAIGPHRLIIRDLEDAASSLAGQYYVEVDGRFVMDDVPNETRADLRRILQSYRKAARPSSSGRTD
jgi:hypothetical protein